MGGSWPIQIAKDAKIRKFTVRKVCSGEKAKGVPGQPFAEESLCMTHSTQPSQQKPEIDMGYSGKIYGGPSYLMTWISVTYTGDSRGF